MLQYVRECPICQQNKHEHSFPRELLQPLPIPERKRDSVSMDFITSLPRIQGRDCIYVVVDQVMKFVHFFAISSTYIVVQTTELFFRVVGCTGCHGASLVTGTIGL